MMADPRQLFFLHIPKTAGTSIIQFLREAADGPVHFEGGPVSIDDIPARDLAKFRVIGGHIPFHFAHWGFTKRKNTLPRFGRALWRPSRVYLAVLREPVETVISHHRFVQRYKGHGWATSGDLQSAFHTREKFVRQMQNLQCYYLSGRRQADAALRTIDQIPCLIGTVDRLDLVAEALNGFFGSDLSFGHLNAAPTPVDWEAYHPIQAQLDQVTRDDQVLYQTIKAKGLHSTL